MFFSAVILLGAYAGYRLIETIRTPDPGEREADGCRAGADQTDNAEEAEEAEEADEADVLADSGHTSCLTASVAAMGLTSAGFVGVAIPLAGPVGLLLTVYATLPMLRRAEDSLRQRKIDNDVLSSTVSLSTLGLGLLFASGLQAGAYHLGQLMALRAKHASERSVLDVIELSDSVRLRCGGVEVVYPLEDLQIGDIIVVSAGEVIPVDGTIVTGFASIDERALNGEPAPADKEIGDQVFATTIIVSGLIDVKVQRSGADTAAARVTALLEQTTAYKSELQLQGERWSDRAAAPVMIASVLSASFIGMSSAIGLLFAAPTNAVRATGSLQTASHLTSVTRGGVLVRDGRGLEALAKIDTVLFDKTGTLTEDTLEFEALYLAGSLTEQWILTLAAALDQRVSHPVAAAIIREAHRQGLELPPVEALAVVFGGGVRGEIGGQSVHVGSRRFIERHGVTVDDAWVEHITLATTTACTNVFVAVDGRVEGAIALRPRIRSEAEQVIRDLRVLGVRHIAVVSGDAAAATEAVATSLQVDAWHAEILPEQKAEIVAKLQAEGRSVCFVGDGINDALAMKTANTSISLTGAASIATETAQLVLLDGSLRGLPTLVAKSHELQRGLQVNLGFWGAYAVGAIIGAGFLGAGVVATTLAYTGALTTSGVYSAWPLMADQGPRPAPPSPRDRQGEQDSPP